VNLGKLLEEIGVGAFDECLSVRLRMGHVNLGEGLEKIGKKAFGECTSLQRLVIPPAVTKIHKKSFFNCSNLTNVIFCDEIEEFLTAESMREWWNHGVHEKSLCTYCFLVRCSIPKRVGLVR
jgi:hypothetical protein